MLCPTTPARFSASSASTSSGPSTVSTAALDVVNLVRRGATVLGFAYVLLTVGTGMAALWLGLVIGS